MVYFTKEQILLIHSVIISETGGSHGVRDHHAILALEHLPRQKFGSQELYKTIFEKAAVYARNIIMGHPFVDSNKRTGMTAASVFLENNGYKITAKEGEVERFALQIVKGKSDLETITKWLKTHSRKIKQ